MPVPFWLVMVARRDWRNEELDVASLSRQATDLGDRLASEQWWPTDEEPPDLTRLWDTSTAARGMRPRVHNRRIDYSYEPTRERARRRTTPRENASAGPHNPKGARP